MLFEEYLLGMMILKSNCTFWHPNVTILGPPLDPTARDPADNWDPPLVGPTCSSMPERKSDVCTYTGPG